MPKQQPADFEVILNKDPDSPAPFPPYLPLAIFDNEEYDCRTPGEWISLGEENGFRKPVPGIALLPSNDEDANSMRFFLLLLYTEHFSLLEMYSLKSEIF